MFQLTGRNMKEYKASAIHRTMKGYSILMLVGTVKPSGQMFRTYSGGEDSRYETLC